MWHIYNQIIYLLLNDKVISRYSIRHFLIVIKHFALELSFSKNQFIFELKFNSIIFITLSNGQHNVCQRGMIFLEFIGHGSTIVEVLTVYCENFECLFFGHLLQTLMEFHNNEMKMMSCYRV